MLVRPKAVSQLASTITARSLSASRVAPVRPSLLSSSSASPLRSSSFKPALRRAYADAAAPPPAPKKRFRFFRWTYRLTVLSGLGLTGYLAYSIYLLRHPEEQIEPDPSKKTLVILGMSIAKQQVIKIKTDVSQEVDGAPSRCSKSSTPKTTMSSSSRRAISSSSPRCCPRALRA